MVWAPTQWSHWIRSSSLGFVSCSNFEGSWQFQKVWNPPLPMGWFCLPIIVPVTFQWGHYHSSKRYHWLMTQQWGFDQQLEHVGDLSRSTEMARIVYIVIPSASWWGFGAAMATLRPSSWKNPRSFQWASIHVNEQVTTTKTWHLRCNKTLRTFSYLLHLGNLFPCIKYTSIETLECVKCVHAGSPVKKEFRWI